MALRLNGSSSGYVELDVPAAAGSHTLTLPDGGGSSGQYLQTDGSGGLSWQTVTTPTVAFTYLNSASLSGASTTITGIPSTATMVIVGWIDTSDTGGNSKRVRLGTSSGIVSTNYETSDGYLGGGANNGAYARSDAYDFGAAGMGVNTFDGRIVFTRMGQANQLWYGEGSERLSGASVFKWYTIGSVDLGGPLERAQLSIPSGSFDNGTMYVYYI